MKCPICGKDVELKNRQVGTDENGEPVFNEYAICRDCKKQWNLDKQRAKKMAAKAAASPAPEAARKSTVPEAAKVKTAAPGKEAAPRKAAVKNSSAEKPSAEKRAAEQETSEKSRPVKRTAPRKKAAGSEEGRHSESESSGSRTRKAGTDRTKVVASRKSSDSTDRTGKSEGTGSVKSRPAKKRTEESSSSEAAEEKRYANIPSEKVRAKREKAVRKGYEDMLSTDPKHKTSRKKAAEDKEDEKEAVKTSSGKHRDEVKTARKTPEPVSDDSYDDDDFDYDDVVPRFRAMRIIMGVLSLLGFAFFIYNGFIDGLQGVSSGSGTSGTPYIILALCFLVAAMLYFIMMRRNTVFAFLLPMLFYLGSAIVAFLMRGDDTLLLISAVAGGVLAVVSLILAIASRGSDIEDDDYDDPFEDEHDN